jgi:hypothetical protein
MDVEDLEQDRVTCEMCESAEVRYVHTMMHPDYGRLRVGCVCAGNMEDDYAGAVAREAMVKGKRSWLDRKWRVSGKGNPFLNTRDGFNVVVWQLRSGGWMGRVVNRYSEKELGVVGEYGSCEFAKLACLRLIEWEKARDAKEQMIKVMGAGAASYLGVK